MTSDVSVVIATRNRKTRLLDTLRELHKSRCASIVVVDNGSHDGTSAAVHRCFSCVTLIRLRENAGAYARTIGARATPCRYIAFCDDDSWWTPESMRAAAEILERFPQIGALNARVLVNGRTIDPACARMECVRANDGLPGAPISFFMGGAVMMRRSAFLESGGYEPRFLIGAEEMLLAIDLQQRGWSIRYLPELLVHHYPSAIERDSSERRRLVTRNRLWTAWMRFRIAPALRETCNSVLCASRDRDAFAGCLGAFAGATWALRKRRPMGKPLQASINAHSSALL